VRESVPRITDSPCFRPGTSRVTNRRARATRPQCRDPTPKGGESSDQPIERAWKRPLRPSETSAGVIAGSWFVNPAKCGGELIAAGLLMVSGHTDLDELDRWMHVGWRRRRGSMWEFGFEEN
jgi:hypothetical protein